jgi:hypothetical protein
MIEVGGAVVEEIVRKREVIGLNRIWHDLQKKTATKNIEKNVNG